MVSEWEKFNTNRINAEAGSAVAQYYLGHCYWMGINVARDQKKAVKWLELSAAQDYKEAQRLLTEALGYTSAQIASLKARRQERAQLASTLTVREDAMPNAGFAAVNIKASNEQLQKALSLATGVNKDYVAALMILKPYADGGDETARAMYAKIQSGQREEEQRRERTKPVSDNVSFRSESETKPRNESTTANSCGGGVSVQPAPKSVAVNIPNLREIRERAARGDTDAQFLLGESYYYGKNVEKDYDLAVMWYRNAAEGGHAEAANQMGNCYVLGNGVAADYEKAYYWFKSAVAVGCMSALYNLGICFRNGWGVASDKTLELDCYRRAAEGGNARAQYEYGKAAYTGEGGIRDAETATKWLTKASRQKFAPATVLLAKFYENGFCGEVDPYKAYCLFQQVADSGAHEADSELAKYYAQGVYVERNFDTAATLARAGAVAGNAANQRLLAKIYEKQGKYGEAFHWTLLSAREFDGESLYELGRYYAEGKGTAPNTQEAFRSYKAAVDAGYTEALLPLADCYERGLGVTKDKSEATRLKKLAKQFRKERINE